MKKFNITKRDVFLLGKHLPIGCVYGQFHIDYKYKKFIGFQVVIDKTGNKVYNANGTPKMRKQFKTVHVCKDIVYYCDDFKPYKVLEADVDQLAYNIYIYNPEKEKWIRTNTAWNSGYEQLGKFLCEMFEKNNLKPTRKCGKNDHFKTVAKSCVSEKKAQVFSDSPFGVPNVGYAISKRVMTNGYNGWVSYDQKANIGGL